MPIKRSNKRPPPTQRDWNIAVHDYVIGDDGKKKWLLQVSSVADGRVFGTLDKDRAYNPQSAEFTNKQIIATLGHNPPQGSVFGIHIEPFRRTLEHPDWGDVHWFVNMKKDDKLVLREALTRVAKLLKKRGLFHFVAEGNLNTEIYAPKGKWTGMYICAHRGDVAADKMQLRPKAGIANDYTVAHESGHGVWFRLLDEKWRARWVRFYNKFCKEVEHDQELIGQLRDDFIKDEIPIKDFRSQLDPDQTALFDLIIDAIKANHRLTTRHLDMLITNGYGEEFRDLWPESVEDTDFEIPVSDYGTTKPEELFAEAFAFWLLGRSIPADPNDEASKPRKLPESVQKLMDKTIAQVTRSK